MTHKLDADGPTFGEALRGMRLGWRWSAAHGGYVHIHIVGSSAVVQLRPAGLIPAPKRVSEIPYVCWWDEKDFLECIAELRPIRRVKRPIYFEVPLDRSA